MTSMTVALLAAVIAAIAVCGDAAADQCTSLHSLYHRSPNQRSWLNSSGWAQYVLPFNGTCCTWFGITCNEQGRIIRIALAANNMLSGDEGLPEEWSTLGSLESIDVSYNTIRGPLPASFTALSSLKRLVFAGNAIAGTLPAAWSRLNALEHLDGSHNYLDGGIPPAWGAMPSLRVIKLANNRLVGAVPPELKACDVSFSGNSGINGTLQSLFPWAGLTSGWCPALYLTLFGTSVGGTIPCIANVSRLELSYTNVYGAVPCCPKSLEYLGAEGTMLSTWQTSGGEDGASPLQFLYLSNTLLTHIPTNLALMFPVLKHLSVRNLNLVQLLPDLPQSLTVLDAADNSFLAQSSPRMFIPDDFVMMDLSSTSRSGLNMRSMNFSCNRVDDSTKCFATTGLFKGIGRQNVGGGFNRSSPSLVSDDTLASPSILLQPDRLLLMHMGPYDFLSVNFTCMFQPRLLAVGGLSGSSLPPNIRKSIPVPNWNSTFIAVSSSPSKIVAFTGLEDSSLLLFGVKYEVSVTFLFRPVLLTRKLGNPLGPVSRTVSAGSVLPALCNPTLFGVPFTLLCAGCPEDAICNGSSFFAASNGFWRPSAAVLPLVRCPVSAGCRQQSPTVPRAGSECSEGYGGPLCGACDSGYGRDSANECVVCSPPAWNAVILAAGAAALLAVATLVSLSTVDDDSHSADLPAHATDGLQRSISAAQIIAVSFSRQNRLLAATSAKKIQSHMGLYALVGRLALLNNRQTSFKVLQTIQQLASQLSIRSISFVSCLFPGFSVVTQFQVLLVVVPAVLLLEVGVVRVVKKQWAVFSVIGALCTLMYDMIINIALLLVPIDTYTFYDVTQFSVNRTFAVPLETLEVLSMDLGVPSDTSSTQSWRVAALVFLAVFGVGFPALLAGVIRHFLRTGRDRLVHDTFGFLTSTYRPECWFWEQVIALRKLALACVVVGLMAYPLAQAQGMLVVLLTYIVLMEAVVPYASTFMHTAERCTCGGAVLLVNIVMGVAASTASSASSSSAESDTASNNSLAVLNVTVQYVALVVLLALLVAEWRSRKISATADAPLKSIVGHAEELKQIAPSPRSPSPSPKLAAAATALDDLFYSFDGSSSARVDRNQRVESPEDPWAVTLSTMQQPSSMMKDVDSWTQNRQFTPEEMMKQMRPAPGSLRSENDQRIDDILDARPYQRNA
jgi:hypothetical protein